MLVAVILLGAVISCKTMIMKRYLAFYGAIYYAKGGMDDFLGEYDTIEDAIRAINKQIEKDKYYDTIEEMWQHKWAHIWDTETRSEVWSK